MKLFRKFHEWFSDYIYDSSININDRTFMMFSSVVLLALIAAIPCGLIMREPPFATISTAIGAVFFLIYVICSYRKNTLARAKIVISFILVFIFLPAMLISNGGVEGGAPIWLLLGTIYIALILQKRRAERITYPGSQRRSAISMFLRVTYPMSR